MENLELKENVDLKKYNTLSIGGVAKYLYYPKNSEELLESLKVIKDAGYKWFIIGGGSNIILPDEDFDGVIISLRKIKKIKIINNVATIDAGVTLAFLNNSLFKKGYTNFIWASGIPGTLGGALKINAGAFEHSMFENLISIRGIKDGEIIEIKKEDIEYGYRYTNLKDIIIVSGTFNVNKGDSFKAVELMKNWTEERIDTQPLDYFNAGSTFKNPSNDYAGRLIESCGLKGRSINDAKVSTKHANFIINKKNATSKDIIELIDIVKKEVKEKENVDLILENEIIIWDNL